MDVIALNTILSLLISLSLHFVVGQHECPPVRFPGGNMPEEFIAELCDSYLGWCNNMETRPFRPTSQQEDWWRSLATNTFSKHHSTGTKSRSKRQAVVEGNIKKEEPEKANSAPSESGMKRLVRKEYRSLTDAERHRFHEAVRQMKRRAIDGMTQYDLFVGYHQGSMAPGAYFGPAFLPWHREFLLRFENALRSIDPTVSLPYWNSNIDHVLGSDTVNSVMWSRRFLGNGVGPVVTGPFAGWRLPFNSNGRNMLYRNLTSTDENDRYVPTLMDDKAVGSFKDAKRFRDITWYVNAAPESYFGAANNWVGGVMKDLANSPSDPAFFLHHAFLDCLWEAMRDRKREAGLDPRYDYPNDTEALGVGLKQPNGEVLRIAENSAHNFNSPLYPFLPLRNRDAMGDVYTSTYYSCAPSPSCSPKALQCGSPYLFCDVRSYRCAPKLRLGALCVRFGRAPTETETNPCHDSYCCNGVCITDCPMSMGAREGGEETKDGSQVIPHPSKAPSHVPDVSPNPPFKTGQRASRGNKQIYANGMAGDLNQSNDAPLNRALVRRRQRHGRFSRLRPSNGQGRSQTHIKANSDNQRTRFDAEKQHKNPGEDLNGQEQTLSRGQMENKERNFERQPDRPQDSSIETGNSHPHKAKGINVPNRAFLPSLSNEGRYSPPPWFLNPIYRPPFVHPGHRSFSSPRARNDEVFRQRALSGEESTPNDNTQMSSSNPEVEKDEKTEEGQSSISNPKGQLPKGSEFDYPGPRLPFGPLRRAEHFHNTDYPADQGKQKIEMDAGNGPSLTNNYSSRGSIDHAKVEAIDAKENELEPTLFSNSAEGENQHYYEDLANSEGNSQSSTQRDADQRRLDRKGQMKELSDELFRNRPAEEEEHTLDVPEGIYRLQNRQNRHRFTHASRQNLENSNKDNTAEKMPEIEDNENIPSHLRSPVYPYMNEDFYRKRYGEEFIKQLKPYENRNIDEQSAIRYVLFNTKSDFELKDKEPKQPTPIEYTSEEVDPSPTDKDVYPYDSILQTLPEDAPHQPSQYEEDALSDSLDRDKSRKINQQESTAGMAEPESSEDLETVHKLPAYGEDQLALMRRARGNFSPNTLGEEAEYSEDNVGSNLVSKRTAASGQQTAGKVHTASAPVRRQNRRRHPFRNPHDRHNIQ